MPRDTCGARTLDPAEPARPAEAHEPRLVLSFATETVLTNLPDIGFHRQTNKCWDTCVYEVSEAYDEKCSLLALTSHVVTWCRSSGTGWQVWAPAQGLIQ